MPVFHFACETCGEPTRKLLKPAQAREPQACKCGGPLKRQPAGASSTVHETLDNGIMVKRVERFANAEEMLKERSRNSGPGKES